MPWRDPDNWTKPIVMTPLIAVALGFLRATYHGKEPSVLKRLIDAIMCGLISFACFHAIEAMGMPQSLGVFIGGAIGLLGVEYANSLARRFLDKKVDDK